MTTAQELVGEFAEADWSDSLGQEVVRVPAEQLREFAETAKAAGFEILSDVTAVDWLDREPRFDVVLNLLSIEYRCRLRIIVGAGGEEPAVPSVVSVWPGANFGEREVFDMFGIAFSDHPDLTRILMPDDWEGYPLRKDFATGSVPVQFKGSHKVR